MKRQRGRGRGKPNGGGGGGGGGHGNPNRSFESNGPDKSFRGSAAQIFEKYQQAARDASSSGDRVLAESYLQHAEHYYRVMRAMQPSYSPPVQDQRFGMEPEAEDDEQEAEAGSEPTEAQGERAERGDRGERPERGERRDRDRDRDRDRGREPRQQQQSAEGERPDMDGEEGDFRRRRRRGRFRPGGEGGERGPREAGAEHAPVGEGFADSPPPAFLAGD